MKKYYNLVVSVLDANGDIHLQRTICCNLLTN